MLKALIPLVAFAGLLAGPSMASAAILAVVTANLHLRAGPGMQYPAVKTLPAGTRVASYGCTAGYIWCDVSWGDERGWVSASYMQVIVNGQSVVLTAAAAPAVGLGILTFRQAYWDRYYVGRPWYRRRAYYSGAPVYRRGGTVCHDGACERRGTVVGPRGRVFHREGTISRY